MTVFVQFESEAKEKVIGVFSCAQDPEFWPNVEGVDDDDERLLTFLDGVDVKGTL
jgi:hypothetical protein